MAPTNSPGPNNYNSCGHAIDLIKLNRGLRAQLRALEGSLSSLAAARPYFRFGLTIRASLRRRPAFGLLHSLIGRSRGRRLLPKNLPPWPYAAAAFSRYSAPERWAPGS